jgi:hypothetical protein
MQSPPLTLNKEIVGPLLSHREWKSLYFHPCSEPLNSMYVTNLLLRSSFCKYSFSSFSVAHFELAKNSLMIEAIISFSLGFWFRYCNRGFRLGFRGFNFRYWINSFSLRGSIRRFNFRNWIRLLGLRNGLLDRLF